MLLVRTPEWVSHVLLLSDNKKQVNVRQIKIGDLKMARKSDQISQIWSRIGELLLNISFKVYPLSISHINLALKALKSLGSSLAVLYAKKRLSWEIHGRGVQLIYLIPPLPLIPSLMVEICIR